MVDAEKLSLEAMGRWVEASEGIRFEGKNREQVYGWVEQAYPAASRLILKLNANRRGVYQTPGRSQKGGTGNAHHG